MVSASNFALSGSDLSIEICLHCINFAFRFDRTRNSRFQYLTTVSGCKFALIRSHLCASMSLRRVAFVTPSLSCWHRSFSIVQYGVSFEFCVDQVGFVNFVSSARFDICISPFVVIAFLVFGICVRCQVAY